MTQHTASSIKVDGTKAATELHRNAYNAAFYELGLGWHWDANTYDGLQPLNCDVERVRIYMENHQSHLLRAYDPGFLAGAIATAKSRCLDTMQACGAAVAARTDWAALQSRQIGS
jgi:hypothetical protein